MTFHLNNSLFGGVLVYWGIGLAFAFFMMQSAVKSLPVELEEAAMVDGLSRTQAFLRITFPLLAPGLVASGVYAFLQAWNEYTLALVVIGVGIREGDAELPGDECQELLVAVVERAIGVDAQHHRAGRPRPAAEDQRQHHRLVRQ